VNRSKRKSLLFRQAVDGYLFLLPAYLIILAVLISPILYSIWMSFHNIELSGNGLQWQLAGWDNYKLLLHSPRFWQAVEFTLLFTIATVLIEVVLGTLIALGLHRPLRGKTLLMVIMVVPWTLMTSVSSQLWRYMLDGVYGIVNYVFLTLHLVDHPVIWLGQPLLATLSMVVADVWKTTPFVALIVYAGLQAIPAELYEAARTDGANSFVLFRKITLPLLKNSLVLAALLRILQGFGLFDLPFVLTQGGPGTATEPVAMLAWKTMFQDLNFGAGSAISVVTVLISLVLALLFLWVIRAQVGGGESVERS
jgi:multiple sugar transport system permease protein